MFIINNPVFINNCFLVSAENASHTFLLLTGKSCIRDFFSNIFGFTCRLLELVQMRGVRRAFSNLLLFTWVRLMRVRHYQISSHQKWMFKTLFVCGLRINHTSSSNILGSSNFKKQTFSWFVYDFISQPFNYFQMLIKSFDKLLENIEDNITADELQYDIMYFTGKASPSVSQDALQLNRNRQLESIIIS